MTNAELWALKAWFLITVLAGVSLFMGWVVILLVFGIVTIPLALFVNLTPTLWLYLTPILILYALLRLALRKRPVRPWVLASAAAAVVAGAGFAVPTLANREIERRADRIMAEDLGTEPLLAPVQSIALLVDRGLGSPEGKCWDQCQRLLFSGLATTVVQGSLDVLDHRADAREWVVRHRIVPISAGCDNSLLQAAHADRSEWSGGLPPPYLWEKLEELAEKGRCFRSDRSQDVRADVYLVQEFGYRVDRIDAAKPPRFDLRLVRFDPPQRWAVLRREGERLVPVLRRTQLVVNKLSVPLAFAPPEEFSGFRPGGWALQKPERRGREQIEGLMRPWLRNDLRLSGLGGENRPIEISVQGGRRRD